MGAPLGNQNASKKGSAGEKAHSTHPTGNTAGAAKVASVTKGWVSLFSDKSFQQVYSHVKNKNRSKKS